MNIAIPYGAFITRETSPKMFRIYRINKFSDLAIWLKAYILLISY